jgi:DNA-binding LytR/AlgR family response regulator
MKAIINDSSKVRSNSSKTTLMETKQDVIEQLREQFGILTQEVSSYKHLLEDLLKKQISVPQKHNFTKMLVKSNGRLIIVHFDDIDWIEAWGDYVRLHCKGKTHIVRQRIREIETKLDQQQFLRIGRSTIINEDRIKEMEPMNHGDYLITLQDSTRLNLSRNYRNCLSVMFDNHL